jgi:hypothetical protein
MFFTISNVSIVLLRSQQRATKGTRLVQKACKLTFCFFILYNLNRETLANHAIVMYITMSLCDKSLGKGSHSPFVYVRLDPVG